MVPATRLFDVPKLVRELNDFNDSLRASSKSKIRCGGEPRGLHPALDPLHAKSSHLSRSTVPRRRLWCRCCFIVCSRLQLANLYRVVSGCAHDRASFPGLLDALLKPDAFSAQLDGMVKTAQLWVVHNTMDVGSVDVEVRSRFCALCGVWDGRGWAAFRRVSSPPDVELLRPGLCDVVDCRSVCAAALS